MERSFPPHTLREASASSLEFLKTPPAEEFEMDARKMNCSAAFSVMYV